MSGAVVVTPSTGAAWATAWEQFEGIRKGLISLSLTNYDATTVPQIASGSWIEAAGSIYKWTGNDTITGSLTSDAINYITMVPSGTGASAILTPTWSDTPPTWSDAYQGYYSGTTRYAGGCYYDGTNYVAKWIYENRDSGSQIRYFTVPLVGWVDRDETVNISPLGSRVQFTSPGTLRWIIFPVNLPHGAIVINFSSTCSTRTSGTLGVDLLRADGDGTFTTMAETTLDAVETDSDSTIVEATIDNTAYSYYVYASLDVDGIIALGKVMVTYIVTRKLA